MRTYANERRDWRIHAALAQRLITQARTLYVDEELGLDLTNTVYALDSTTIALRLSVFPWAHFRTTKAAVKMHTLLDLRGNIPSFIHISDGKLHDVHALDMLLPEAGAIYVVDRGYVDFARLYVLHQAGAFFVTRAKSNIDAHRVYSAPTDRSTGIICDQTISLDGFYTRQDYPELLRRIRFKDPESGKTLVFAHSVTTRRLPLKPSARRRRHNSVPFRQPMFHSLASLGSHGSRLLCRSRKTSSRSSRWIWRTRLRLSPVMRPICLIGRPSSAMRRTSARSQPGRKGSSRERPMSRFGSPLKSPHL